MAWELRDFEGYMQVRETAPGHRPGRWKFQIYGFGDDDCSVYRSDKTLDRVPIDARHRITINGRKFGPAHWNH